ncbi:unnamed protein product [Oreochromis niloticus]|nr:unnamed protein product [Mustela putorius furo]
MVASAMFPPLVQFSCKRQKKNGGEPEELPPAEGEQLELRESGWTTSVLVDYTDDLYTYRYSCYVKHEGEHGGSTRKRPLSLGDCSTVNPLKDETLKTQTTHVFCFSVPGSTGLSFFTVQGEAALPAVHSADSEESGVLLWTLSADDPHKQGTVHQLHTC